ncbi:porin [Herbaspirillum lusitanum]|uniref:porin n=1 Tax=Herbaspirillum lusitanum TaxID=213312 RepID=UPI000311C1E9|nr:porin [Herbaspirillum lusitanum]
MQSSKFNFAGFLIVSFSLSIEAHAEVTVYGVVDVGIEALSNAPVAGTKRGGTLIREQSANAQLSRIGFKGSETIDPCLKAIFKLDAAFFPDTGSLSPNGKLFHGSSYVGLSGCQGELTLGRHISLLYEEAYYFDPLSIFAYSLPSMDVTGFGGRADNSIKYRRSLGSWTLTGFYSTGYSGAYEETAGSPRIAREMSMSINYDDRFLAGGIAIDHLNGTTPDTKNQITDRIFLAGSLTFEKDKIFAGYQHYHQTALNAIPVATYDLIWAGAQHAWSAQLNSAVGVFHQKYSTGQGSATLAAAYLDYFLSKRTDVYMNVGYMKNSGSLNLGVDGQPGIIGPGTLPGQAQAGLAIGVRHTF